MITLDNAICNRDWYTALTLIRVRAKILDMNRVSMAISGRDEETIILFTDTYSESIPHIQYWLARRSNVDMLNKTIVKYRLFTYALDGFIDSSNIRQLQHVMTRMVGRDRECAIRTIRNRCGETDNLTVFMEFEKEMKDSDLEIVAMDCANYGSRKLLYYLLKHYPLNYDVIAMEAARHGGVDIVQTMTREYNVRCTPSVERIIGERNAK